MDSGKVHSQETQIYLVRLAVKKSRLASCSPKSAVKKPRPTWWGSQENKTYLVRSAVKKQDLTSEVSIKKKN